MTPDGDYYKEDTIYNINSRIKRFQEYEIALGSEIMMNDLSYEWVENYRLFLLDSNYSKNTISNILSNLKTFIKRFYRSGLIKYDGSGIRTSSEVTTAIFNTIEELRFLKNIDLTETPGRERIRDIYLIQCFLGLRVSDMFDFIENSKLYIKKVDGKCFFEIKTNKTGEVVVIPASPVVLGILEKRNYDLGKRFSEQYYRLELKLIISKSEIDREIIFNRTEGGEKMSRVVLFSSLMGTHSARRTFATNAYLVGLNPLDIMKITGHKTFTAFIRYIRCDNMAVALRISDHEFFNFEL